MLGERSDQRGLWEADRLYLDHVGRDTFYGLMASLRGRLFRDADFAAFYCPNNGRDSVPPSLLAAAQPAGHGPAAPVSRQGQRRRGQGQSGLRHPLEEPAPRPRPGVALGIEVEDRPFAKSTLQVFRAQLILHDKVREVFESSLRLARESGYLKKRSMKVALDHDQHPGPGRGEGHLQPVGRRDRPTGPGAGTVEGHQRRTMGEESGIPSILGFQRERRGRHRLERQTGPDGAAGRDCGRRGPAAGVVAAGAGGVGGGQR